MADRKDKYADFVELSAQEQEGVDFSVSVDNRNSGITIIAPHGGGIEPGTSEIAKGIAGEDLNVALFEGMKSRWNFRDLHITSANFNEERCVEIVRDSDFVLAVHGKEREKDKDDEEIVYIGGLDFALREAITSELEKAGFVVEIPEKRLQGIDSRNICNRGTRGCGVQLEITEALRAQFFNSPEWNRRRNAREDKTEKFEQFIAAVRRGLQRGGAL